MFHSHEILARLDCLQAWVAHVASQNDAILALEDGLGNRELEAKLTELKKARTALEAAVAAQTPTHLLATTEGNPQMNPLQPVIDEMTNDVTVMTAATTFIGTVPGLISAAVAAAIANGATAAQLQPVTDLGTQLTAQRNALQAALAANTPNVSDAKPKFKS